MIFVTATFRTFSTQAFARRWRAIGHASISSRLDVTAIRSWGFREDAAKPIDATLRTHLGTSFLIFVAIWAPIGVRLDAGKLEQFGTRIGWVAERFKAPVLK